MAKIKTESANQGVGKPARPRSRRGGVWVTRPDVHVDRIASAWLIKRFIDPKARFVFGAAREGAVSFDMFEGEYTHEGDRCTFETLLQRFGLDRDDALRAIAEMVHDLDVKDGKFGREETPGFQRMIGGIVKRHARDEARIERGTELLNDLYESLRPPHQSNQRKAEPLNGVGQVRAVVEHRRWPASWQAARWVPSLELNHERQKSGYIDVAATTGRNQGDSCDRRAVRLTVGRVIHVECVGRVDPASIDEHRRTVGEPERRNQRNARRPLEAASGPCSLGGKIVNPTGRHAPLARAVSRQSAPHFECRQRETGHLDPIASAPLR